MTPARRHLSVVREPRAAIEVPPPPIPSLIRRLAFAVAAFLVALTWGES